MPSGGRAPRTRAPRRQRLGRRPGVAGRADRLDQLRGGSRESPAVAVRRTRRVPAPAGSRQPVAAAAGGSTCRRRRALPSGVRKTVIGQPPVPGQRDDRVHVDRGRGRAAPRGRPSTFTKCSFICAAGLVVLERLVLHHVAPVAGGVADREQDRRSSAARRPSASSPPRVPVDRVVRCAGGGTGWSRGRGGSSPPR
jgi:hypothetical protein